MFVAPPTGSWRIFHRLVAAGGAALIFALGLFSASPILHQHLHSGSVPIGDDHCVVATFSAGVPISIAPITISPPIAAHTESYAPIARDICLDSPAYRLLPGRGPPFA